MGPRTNLPSACPLRFPSHYVPLLHTLTYTRMHAQTHAHTFPPAILCTHCTWLPLAVVTRGHPWAIPGHLEVIFLLLLPSLFSSYFSTWSCLMLWIRVLELYISSTCNVSCRRDRSSLLYPEPQAQCLVLALLRVAVLSVIK